MNDQIESFMAEVRSHVDRLGGCAATDKRVTDIEDAIRRVHQRGNDDTRALQRFDDICEVVSRRDLDLKTRGRRMRQILLEHARDLGWRAPQ